MTEAWIAQFGRVNSLLEEGWYRCLRLVAKFKKQAEETIRDRMGFSRLPSDEVLKSLHEFCPALYREISDTLFNLVALVQPDDFERRGRRLNFYFWPGYHSFLGNRRIFIKKDGWNFGVGIGGDAGGPAEHYDDCSQARWYHYLVKKRNRSDVVPGDVHQWLRFQGHNGPLADARGEAGDGRGPRFINSLTATTEDFGAEEPGLFRGHEVLFLDARPQGTKTWGKEYAKFLNSYRTEQPWTFPDHWGKPVEQEAGLRDLRCKMHSIWLHAVFCDNKPEWLDGFITKLELEDDTRPAGKSLRNGLKDEVAADWGDASHGRPLFSCWSYLSLHASLAPLASSGYEPPPQTDEAHKRAVLGQTLGSAELLCSIPLRPRYFSIVRPWLSEVYGLVRNAEISILLQNHKLEARKAELAGPFWAHELMKLTDEGLSTAFRDAYDTSPAAVSSRRFVLHSIRMLTSLAYDFTGPVFSGDQNARKQKDEVLKPLQALYDGGALLDALRHVAEQTYKNICSGRGARVAFPKPAQRGWTPESLSYKEYRSCFLLVSEMVRNYCESEGDECAATWESFLDGSALTVRLSGATRSQRNPSSMTLARLNVFLRALKLGKAFVEWNKEEGVCAYIVEVNLAGRDDGAAGEGGAAAADAADDAAKA